MGRTDETPDSTPLALTQAQFTALLDAVRSGNTSDQTDRLERILLHTAEVSAQAMKKAMKPENDTHPGVSVYSYPDGDLAHARPVLPFELLWNGFPVHQFPETLHWLELELLARLTPGEYYVSKANSEGAQAISVHGQSDANGKVTRLTVAIPGIGRDEMRAAPPLTVWIYQMLQKDRPLAETYLEGTTLFMNHVVMRKAPVLAAA